MKTNHLAKWLASTSLLVAALPVSAGIVGFQGRVVVDGTNYNGTGYFKFALVNNGESITRWSNDGTSVAGSEPSNSISLFVTKGLFSVNLGDIFVPNMTSEITASVLRNYDMGLKVWFSQSNASFTVLSPNVSVTAGSAYSIIADEAQAVKNGGIQSPMFAEGSVNSYAISNGTVGIEDLVDGSVNSDKLANNAVTADKIGAGAVTAGKIASGAVSALGSPNGSLTNALATDNSGNVVIQSAVTASRFINANNPVGANAIALGGSGSSATGAFATAGGGLNNSAGGDDATVGGGLNNTASGAGAAVAGGGYNSAAGDYAFVAGGFSNKAGGTTSFAAGYRARATNLASFVWADQSALADFGSTAPYQFLIRAAGGVGIGTNGTPQMLTVAGNVQASGFIGDGSLLTNLSSASSTNTAFLNSNTVFSGYLGTSSNLVVDPLGLSSGTLTRALVFGNPASGEGISSKYTPGGNQFGLDFYAGTALRMSISSVGNVGIGFGTNVPTDKLAVNGTVSASQYNGNGANLNSLRATNITAGTLDDARLSTNVVLMNSAPSFAGVTVTGIATINSGNNQIGLQLNGTNSAGTWAAMDNSSSGGRSWRFVSTGSANGEGAGHLLIIDNGPGVRMMISSNNGNVGIGTTAPASKLHVAGTVQASSNVVAGAFLAVAVTTNSPVGSTTLSPTTGFVLLAPASNMTLSGVTAISDGSLAGQMLMLSGRGTNTLSISNNANTRLTGTVTLGSNDVLNLVWNGSDWIQVSLSNNL